MKQTFRNGFTLLEMLITVSVLFIILTFGVPNFQALKQSLALSGAVAQTHLFIKKARNLAVRHQQNIQIVFHPGQFWWIGLTAEPYCNCNDQDGCLINGIPHCLRAEDFPQISLTHSSFNQHSALVEGIRGTTVGSAGTALFSDGQRIAKVILSNLGRVRICMLAGELRRYASC